MFGVNFLITALNKLLSKQNCVLFFLIFRINYQPNRQSTIYIRDDFCDFT